jgi:hypothetical protein
LRKSGKFAKSFGIRTEFFRCSSGREKKSNMARVIYGGVGLQGISGSINSQAGGHTFTKNNVVRRRVVPTNPQTASQQEVRGLFSFLTGAWVSQITNADREAWETAKQSNSYYQTTDELNGVSRKYRSGKDLFIAMNTNILVATDAIDTPAVTYSTPAASGFIDAVGISSFVFDASAGTAILTYSGGGLVEERLVVKATPPVSPGVMRLTAVRSQLRTIDGTAGASPVAEGANYVAKFGAITAKTDMKVFWQVEAVNTTTGKSRLVGGGVSIIQA